jgi:hypothetical protein
MCRAVDLADGGAGTESAAYQSDRHGSNMTEIRPRALTFAMIVDEVLVGIGTPFRPLPRSR